MINEYSIPDGYICDRCKRELDPDEVCCEYDSTMTCRYCDGDVQPAYRCEVCEEIVEEDDIFGFEHNVCRSCIEKKRYDLDFCTKVGEDEGTEVALNSFLAEFFTESEINELMLVALKERAKVKPVDGLKYLRYASGVAADLLCEQEKD